MCALTPVPRPYCLVVGPVGGAQSDTKPWEVIGGFISLTHDAYGKKSLAPIVHRVNMTELALRDSDWINVDTWEGAQAG